jgi:type IV secretion system protein VirD4
VFNPENVSGIASTFGWGMTIGCEDPSEAIRRAADLVGAVANVGEMAWWVEKSAAALAAGMHAAALIGGDMGDVWAWANGYGAGAVDDARKHPAASMELFGSLAELDRPGKTADSIRLTMSKALTWLAIPDIRAMVTGPAARPFDVDAFTDNRGTIYMLAPGGDGAPCAPLFRCFASYVHRAARHHGLAQPHRKLDPGLLFALDELHLCPVDLPAWLADSAGKGIQVAAVVHSTGQLRDKYGEHGAATVWSTAGTKIFLPGIHDTATLEDVSRLCGTLGDGDKAQRVMPPELLARLPDWHALVISVNRSPVVIRFRPSWRRIEARLGLAPRPLPMYRAYAEPIADEAVITELAARRPAWPAPDDREGRGESA